LNQYGQAIADYNQAIIINPFYAEAFYNRGVAYAHQGEPGLSIRDYTRAIELGLETENVYWGLGNAYYNQGRYDDALEQYRNYLNLAGNNSSTFVVNRVTELEIATPLPSP
jgi:tetratricopeptide (TPR) repeat protein